MGQIRGYVQTDAHVRARIAARLATLAAKPKPVSKDWLVSHYALLGMDCVQLCDKCHRFVHSKRNTTREFLK